MSRRWFRGIAAALTLVLGLALPACSSIPTTGPVGTFASSAADDDDNGYNFDVLGPANGDAPEAIVRGFLTAGVSANDDYSVARRFLTEEMAGTWDPGERTLVSDLDPKVEPDKHDSSTFDVSLRVTRSIDAVGVKTDSESGRTVSLTFKVAQEHGQWRISEAPNGVVVDASSFKQAFSPVTLYFFDPTNTYAIPDVRWLARRSGRATSVVAALLKGPAPYLKGAVISAFPEEARLARPTVPVENGTATVDVPDSLLAEVPADRRARMVQQLQLSLSDLPSVKNVNLSVGQRGVDVGDPSQNRPLMNPTVDGTLVGLSRGHLVTFDGSDATPVQTKGKLGPDLSSPASAPQTQGYAVLAEKRHRLLTVSGAGEVKRVLEGSNLVAPSIDSSSWVFSGESSVGSAIEVRALDGSGRATLRPEWLSSVRVRSLKVSVDGTRLAMTIDRGGASELVIAGIQRDSSGKPTGLARPTSLATNADPQRVQWLSDRQLLVYRPDASRRVEVVQVSLDMVTSNWPQPLLGMTALTATPGEGRPVYAQNEDALYQRSATTWRQLDTDARDVNYRG